MREQGHVIRMEVEVPGGRYLILAVPLDVKAQESLQFDRPWMATFLHWLQRGRSVTQAAELTGVSRRHAARCRQTDERFALAWESIEALQRTAR